MLKHILPSTKIASVQHLMFTGLDSNRKHIVASELKEPIYHSNECQIGSFSSEATIYNMVLVKKLSIMLHVNVLLLKMLCTCSTQPLFKVLRSIMHVNATCIVKTILLSTLLQRRTCLVQWLERVALSMSLSVVPFRIPLGSWFAEKYHASVLSILGHYFDVVSLGKALTLKCFTWLRRKMSIW